MKNTSLFDWVLFTLVITGSVSWAIIAVFGFDFLLFLFGTTSFIGRFVYGLLSLSSAWVGIQWLLSEQDSNNI